MITHDDDIDDGIIATKDFFENIFDGGVSVKLMCTIRGSIILFIIQLVHEGRDACWLIFAKVKKLLDLSVNHGKEIGIRDCSGGTSIIKEIIKVMGRILGTRIQQLVRERIENAVDSRVIGKRIRSGHDFQKEVCCS